MNESRITITAYGIGETMTLNAPPEWHPRIRALSPYVQYGPSYNRWAQVDLQGMSDAIHSGYSLIAYDYLLRAERQAGIKGEAS